MAYLVKCWPDMQEALSSIPCTSKNRCDDDAYHLSTRGSGGRESQEFKASLGYVVSLKPVSVRGEPVSKKKRKKEGSGKGGLHLRCLEDSELLL